MKALFRLRWGKVRELARDTADLQELLVESEGASRRAINYPCINGRVSPGDTVLLNTTAVFLKLGTGGYDFVVSVSGREERDNPPDGHIIKLRYTPWQIQVKTVEETGILGLSKQGKPLFSTLKGVPVLVGELHSQLAPAVLAAQAAAAKSATAQAANGQPAVGREIRLRIVYIMTDGGALPAWFSRQVSVLRQRGVISWVVTAGHAFGGDAEAVNVYSAMDIAVSHYKADLCVVAMGPGAVGTGTALGFSGAEQAWATDAVRALGGRAVVIPRLSAVDSRARHQTVSHHTLIVLGHLAGAGSVVPLPFLGREKMRPIIARLRESGVLARHHVCFVPEGIIQPILDASPIPLRTMGRGVDSDPEFFLAAAAAGWYAGRLAALVKPHVS